MTDFLDFIDDDDDDDEEEGVDANESMLSLLASRPSSCGVRPFKQRCLAFISVISQVSHLSITYCLQVLQFHNGIEESLLLTIERNTSLTTASEVLDAVDHFSYSKHWMMHIGPVKGKILDDVILQAQGIENKPLVCVEIGSYCGYSTVRIASQFNNDTSIIYSIEREPTCCSWTNRLCNKAGVSSKVCILEGGVGAGIETLLTKNVQIDILFIDHDKIKYLDDLKLFEAAGLLVSPGAIVVADNILSFGVPLADYLEHVRRPVGEGGLYKSSVLHRRTVEYSTVSDCVEDGNELEDGIEISVLN